METKKQKPKSANETELRPDGWERFRSAVYAAAKSGPKHRTKEKSSISIVAEDKAKR